MIAALLFFTLPAAGDLVWDCGLLDLAFWEAASISVHKLFRLFQMDTMAKLLVLGEYHALRMSMRLKMRPVIP